MKIDNNDPMKIDNNDPMKIDNNDELFGNPSDPDKTDVVGFKVNDSGRYTFSVTLDLDIFKIETVMFF